MGTDTLFIVAALLLPVAALSGWLLGRREAATQAARREHSSQIATDYFMGLNYLLHDRPDKAIEVFVKVLEVETETVETHLALGNLFRRRGEVDRAENLFIELLDTGLYQQQALRHLVDIYQQEQDWHKALEFCSRLEAATGQNLSNERAHFLCEQAQALLERQSRDEAQELLDKAYATDRKCVRASLMSANLAMQARDFERALQHLKRVEHQDIDFLPEALGMIVKCHRQLERDDELRDYLERLAALRAGVSPTLALAALMSEQQGREAAKRYVVQELKIRPTIRGIERLIEYALDGAAGEARDDLLILRETALRLIAGKATYKCGSCGFAGRSLHWQCPGCKSWSTVKPIHGIEGE